MPNTILLIVLHLIMLLIKHKEARLISVFGVVNQGPSFPQDFYEHSKSLNETTLFSPFADNNLMPQGMMLHMELGKIIKMKYIDNDSKNSEYGNFSNIEDFESKVRIYSSSSPESLQSAIGQAMGMMPNQVPNIIKIDEKGNKARLLKRDIQSNEIENLKKLKKLKLDENFDEMKNFNFTKIEYFSSSLDVILNSEKCLKFNDEAENIKNKNTKFNIQLSKTNPMKPSDSNPVNNITKGSIEGFTFLDVKISVEALKKNFSIIMNNSKNLTLNESLKILNPNLNITFVKKELVNEDDFKIILSLKNIFPRKFIKQCNKTKCKNDDVFKELDFLDGLYKLVKFVYDYNLHVIDTSDINSNKHSNFLKSKKLEKKFTKISQEVVNVLLKYHLLHLYNHEEKINKQIATPLFRFVNGFLENSKSKHCQNVNTRVILNSNRINNTHDHNKTLNNFPLINSVIKPPKEREFVRLRQFKPVDVLRRTINDCKCAKIVLMVSEYNNLVTFMKTLLNYEEVIKSITDDPLKISSYKSSLDLLDPKEASSIIFQLHEYENNNQTEKLNNNSTIPIKLNQPISSASPSYYIRIFLNLQEIPELAIKSKITYHKDKGVLMDDIINYFNENTDYKVKYKNKCDT